ncbi:nitrous oxide reductase accessory protein NosL [Lutibacter flavus]|uniref:Copper chaperone NosL n=1 Tax=Lutibacter flavus TaxID=691689 RepID=A0A238YQD1_9FLAO|nr:nitrous oxide reductase accessory protein NosL [Lutibacter flavus]SNR73220.1 copper chaperone NosL [Lutibacter flavus]
MSFKLLQPFIGIVIILLTISCKVEPEAIEYGKDQCSFCVMNIVDKTHAAQYVTKKGKQFKFDAIECLVNDLNEKNEQDLAVILVADYGNPGNMIDAKTATYLISTGIKSPMGANLSAVVTLEKALELQQQYLGDIYAWEPLKKNTFPIINEIY